MGLKAKVSRVFKYLSTPLLPDDYTYLLNLLWSSCELRGQIETINPTSPTSAELIIRPGWGMPADFGPGQFIGLDIEVKGRYLWRSYSLTNAPRPRDGLLTINIHALNDGYVSQHLVANIELDTVVRLAALTGDFHLPEPLPARIAFIIAGSDVTPVVSILRDLSARSTSVEVGHIRSYRGETEAMSVNELRGLERRSTTSALKYRLHARNTEAQPRVDAAAVTGIIADFGALALSASTYACGPVELLKNLEPELPGLRTEHFTVDRSAAGGVGDTVSLGSRSDIDVDGATTTLEVAESVGVDLPYDCQMGTYATCVQQPSDGAARDVRTNATFVAGERARTCVCAPAGHTRVEL